MHIENQHFEILNDIAKFADVERYRGMLPAKLALCYDTRKVEELIEANLVERVFISFSCGQESQLLKLTEQGRTALEDLCDPGGEDPAQPRGKKILIQPKPECAELTPEQMQIMSDILHYSKIHRFGGLMPHTETTVYPPRDLNILFARGFVIRVKAELGSGKKRKGLILSDKGLRCLGYA